MNFTGPLAQLVEQLTLNQLVIGSNPIRLIFARVAKLVDALGLGPRVSFKDMGVQVPPFVLFYSYLL